MASAAAFSDLSREDCETVRASSEDPLRNAGLKIGVNW
jgi:hypothetical protein